MYFEQKLFQRLNEIGRALSREQNIPLLLENILLSAKELTHTDGGTIYTVTVEKTVRIDMMQTDTLGLHVGGSSGLPVPYPDLPLFIDGEPNDALIVAYAVNHGKTVVIQDAYHAEGFDFSGTRKFDQKTGYYTQAVLTVPMKNHENEVIAVLQLINPIEVGKVRTFTEEEIALAESLASQTGIVLTNQLLVYSLRSLFESLVKVIADAIDEKSPSTGNHGKRVPIVAQLLAEAVSRVNFGPFKEVHFTKEELYELRVAAFLHDCGKITTPVHVVEKQTKLETIFDRIELIEQRVKMLELAAEKDLLAKRWEWVKQSYPEVFQRGEETFQIEKHELQERLHIWKEELAFVKKCNQGSEKMTEEALLRLSEIARSGERYGISLLTDEELKNLSIVKGTLTEEERLIINHHVVMTYRMLSQLKYPKDLRLVPEIASSHHERVDGKGYPRGLTKDQMSIQARILALSDVFEALSAPDRPYRKPLPLSGVFQIMQEMSESGHLDPDLYEVFIEEKAYLPYARLYLSPEQCDVD